MDRVKRSPLPPLTPPAARTGRAIQSGWDPYPVGGSANVSLFSRNQENWKALVFPRHWRKGRSDATQ